MIIRCESNQSWYSKSTPKVKNFKIIKKVPKSVTFSTDFSGSKLISAEDGKTVIYEGLGYGTLHRSSRRKYILHILYVQVGDDFDINTKECFIY